MFCGLLSRLERAADAFLAPEPSRAPHEAIRKPERRHVADSTPVLDLPSLSEADRQALQDQALGLLDPDVVGWLIVTVRRHNAHADVDVDWRMPDAAWPAVGVCLLDATP